MAEMQSANPVCNGSCSANGPWSWPTRLKAIGLAGVVILFIMQLHGHMDHGGQASTIELDAIRTLIESNARAIDSIQTDVSLIQEILMVANRKKSSSDSEDSELHRLQLRLQNTSHRKRGKIQ